MEMVTRIIKVLRLLSAGLLIGIIYTIFCRVTGIAIPCLFRTVTGLQCPGCGITTLFLELSKGNVTAAFHANPVVFILILPYGMIAIRAVIRYIKGLNIQPGKLQTWFYYVTIMVLVVFGIIRNIC